MLALACLLGVAACSAAQPRDPLVLALISPLAGDDESGLRQGFDLAVREFNARGGYHGQRVLTVIETAGEDPQSAARTVGEVARAKRPTALLLAIDRGLAGALSAAGGVPVLALGEQAALPSVTLNQEEERRWRELLLANFGSAGVTVRAASSYNATRIILRSLEIAGPRPEALAAEIARLTSGARSR